MIKIKFKRTIVAIFFVILFLLIPYKIFGVTITIDAGHGGTDTGAINSSKNIYEKDVNFKIAKFIKEFLSQYKDINVLMTRESDMFLEIYDRGIIGRKNKSDLFISLHLNSSPSGDAKGAEAFVTHNTSLDKYNKQTTVLANLILNNLNKLGIQNRGVKTRLITNDPTDVYSDGTIADYYGVIRYSMRGCKIDSGVIKPEGAVPANIQNGEGVPTILIEHCFINSTDYKYVDTDEEIKAIAKADADAIIKYYNLELKENKKYKYDNENIIIVPGTKLSQIDAAAQGELKTGKKIKVKDKEYTVSILGDVSGDGVVNSADLLKIVKHLKGILKITDKVIEKSADINFDDAINSADLLKIVKHLKGISQITM